MYRTDFWTLWEKARVGCFKRSASKHVYYLGWNRSPAQVGCIRQVLGADALGRPRGIGWRGRREGGSGWGTHVNPWLIHVSVWQNPLKYCKVISLHLIKTNEKKKKKKEKKAPSRFMFKHRQYQSVHPDSSIRWSLRVTQAYTTESCNLRNLPKCLTQILLTIIRVFLLEVLVKFSGYASSAKTKM